jgi:hypothetical protein
VANLPSTVAGHHGTAFFSAEQSVLLEDKNDIDVHRMTVGESEYQLPYPVRFTLACWQAWELAVNRHLELTEPQWPDLRRWKYFSDLANPFEPLLDLWCTGYRMIASFTEVDPGIRLIACPVAQEDTDCS